MISDIELRVLSKFLAGDHRGVRILRDQVNNLIVKKRDGTKVSFMTEFDHDAKIGSNLFCEQSIVINDVVGDVTGMQYGMGFLLFVKNGYLDALEGYSFDGAIPANIIINSLYYMNNDNRDWEAIGNMLRLKD